MGGHKDRRAELDRKNKWQTEEVKGDQVDKLKTYTTQAIGLSNCQKMFSSDFKLLSECIDLFDASV